MRDFMLEHLYVYMGKKQYFYIKKEYINDTYTASPTSLLAAVKNPI